ncbi:hypothetical protein Pelo_11516 [Pelomyxa schiedti]|nr:hypothetical protein Pelo_11516 [Pelomyxa schiedti]
MSQRRPNSSANGTGRSPRSPSDAPPHSPGSTPSGSSSKLKDPAARCADIYKSAKALDSSGKLDAAYSEYLACVMCGAREMLQVRALLEYSTQQNHAQISEQAVTTLEQCKESLNRAHALVSTLTHSIVPPPSQPAVMASAFPTAPTTPVIPTTPSASVLFPQVPTMQPVIMQSSLPQGPSASQLPLYTPQFSAFPPTPNFPVISLPPAPVDEPFASFAPPPTPAQIASSVNACGVNLKLIPGVDQSFTPDTLEYLLILPPNAIAKINAVYDQYTEECSKTPIRHSANKLARLREETENLEIFKGKQIMVMNQVLYITRDASITNITNTTNTLLSPQHPASKFLSAPNGKFSRDLQLLASEFNSNRLRMCDDSVKMVLEFMNSNTETMAEASRATEVEKHQIYFEIESRLFPHIYNTSFANFKQRNRDKDSVLNAKIMSLSEGITPAHLPIKKRFWLVPEGAPPTQAATFYDQAISKMKELPTIEIPKRKLDCLSAVHTAITDCVRNFHNTRTFLPLDKLIMGGDEMTPVMTFVVVKSGVADLWSETDLMTSFLPDWESGGKEAYVLTTFSCCLQYIESLTVEEMLESALKAHD